MNMGPRWRQTDKFKLIIATLASKFRIDSIYFDHDVILFLKILT